MVGYAWEWTDSWFQAYRGNKKHDPRYGQHMKAFRGRLNMKGDNLQSVASRRALEPHRTDPHLGFRCGIDAQQLAALPP